AVLCLGAGAAGPRPCGRGFDQAGSRQRGPQHAPPAAPMSGVRPRACPTCLRRAWLIGSLSAHIETAVEDRAGSRAHEILALPDEELARTMARDRAGSYLDRA